METLHTQAHNIYKNIDNFDLRYVNQITWELPHSTQPWLGTVPGFNPDPPELVPTCKQLRAPKGKASPIWDKRFCTRLLSFSEKCSPRTLRRIVIRQNKWKKQEIPKPLFGLGLYRQSLRKWTVKSRIICFLEMIFYLIDVKLIFIYLNFGTL